MVILRDIFAILENLNYSPKKPMELLQTQEKKQVRIRIATVRLLLLCYSRVSQKIMLTTARTETDWLIRIASNLALLHLFSENSGKKFPGSVADGFLYVQGDLEVLMFKAISHSRHSY